MAIQPYPYIIIILDSREGFCLHPDSMPEPGLATYISNINHTVSRLGITYGVPYVLTFSNTDLN